MTTEMTIDQIIRDLNYCDDEFPEAAIQAAREKRTEITSRLMECIDEATQDSNNSVEVATWGHTAAMFLLTEFHAREAFPSILKSMCSEGVDQLYGDLITESFPYIVAALATVPDDFTVEINDPNVDEYVRGSLVRAVFGMVCEERISRERAVSFLRDRLRTAVEDQDSHISTKCAEMLGHLMAREASADVKAAEDCGLVDEEWIGADYFSKQLETGEAAFGEARNAWDASRRNSSLDSLKTMPWFNQKPAPQLNLETVLQAIQEPFSKFPSHAVRWARRHPEEITPHLIRILEELPGFAADNEVESHGHIIAVFLLTEFGVSAALPLILDILTTESSDVTNCLIDLMDGELAQSLGRLANDPEQLAVLIDNPELEDCIHEEAICAMIWMVTENRLDRDRAIDWLLDRFEKIRRTDHTERCECFAMAFADFGATKCLGVLNDAIEEGHIDVDLVDVEEILADVNKGLEAFEVTQKFHRRVRLENTAMTLEGWDWDESDDDDDYDDGEYGSGEYDSDEIPPGLSVATIRAMMNSLGMGQSEAKVQRVMRLLGSTQDEHFGGVLDDIDEDSLDSNTSLATIRNTQQKVGRNDPCPCGSGKKFKKCCAKAEHSESAMP